MQDLNKANQPESQALGPKVDQISHNFGQTLGEMASKVSTASSEYIDTSRKYVSENPLTGVAIAAGAGIAIGYLASTLASSKKT